jgi:PAS domain S-box-containing protein
MNDITDRKKAEADIQKREKLFRDFFESNPVPTIITSSSGNIHMINPAFSQASGFSVEEVIGETSQELGFWRDLTDRERMVAAIREDGLINNLEASFYTKNNQQLTCLVSSRAIEYEGEQRILSTVLDVTEQRNAEEALRKIDQAKNDFIRIAAHELQTPLVAVLGYAELLENSSQLHANEQQKHYASIISTNAEILSRLVNDLLDVERIQLGRFLSIVRENVSFAELIKKVITSITPKCPEHRFILTHANSLPESICIDEGRIAQVLNNLLTNAVKFSPEGGIIEISTTTDESTVTTSVRDYGLGMTPEHVELVFDKFYRANPENPQISGLGLGMNIVKQIVAEHGGEISISSNLGEGTTVTFTLPLEDIASF